MSIGPRLELRQSQQLVMTPQLQQAIKLLQMSNLELSEYVETELERNPLLERDAEAVDDDVGPDGRDETLPVSADRTVLTEDLSPSETPFDTGAGNLSEVREIGMPAAPSQRARGSQSFDQSDFRIENTLAEATSLLDHLECQIALVRAAPVVLAVARAISAELDDAGYFRADMDETAVRLGVDRATVAEALAVLQSCEPAGVGACDLAECLALQLKDRDRYDPAMQALIENIHLLAKAEFRKLRQICAVDDDDLADMIAEVKALDPRPARAFTGAAAVTIAPDVFVRRGGMGVWLVELNSHTLPRVLVDNTYATEVSRNGDRAARNFISECHQNANWLVKSLAQRARTILKVSEEIVRQQDGFFAFGVTAMKPMTLKSVAEAISMHESTVSRVTSGKFMATERGTFELKYFFTAAIGATNGGEAFSSEAVRRRISGIISDEFPGKPLSDEKIAIILEESGVDIARRTVAKYREAMNIPSSSQRKRLSSASPMG